MEKIVPGQLRVWNKHAGWQDEGKVFVVLTLMQGDLFCDVLQEGRSVRVRTMFIENFSDRVHD